MQRSIRVISLVAGVGALAGCALFNSVQTGTPLTPAAVQQDVDNAVYLMKASGCAIASAGAAAAPVISVAADAQGNQVLQAVTAAGTVACQLTVPASALPVPAPANAPAATAPIAAAPAATTPAAS